MPTPHRKRQRRGTSTEPADQRTAEAPKQVWAADGRLFKILNLVDEHTRQVLACHVARPGADRPRHP